jgi:hypothetical protein
MNRRLFGVLALLAFSTAVVSSSASAREDKKKQTDEEITKLLVGTWIVDETEGTAKIKGKIVYKKDGTEEADVTIEAGGKTIKLTVSATWKVKDGLLIEKVTKRNNQDIIKEDTESKDTVISIDKKEYKFKDEQGKERSYKRMTD